MRYDELTVRVVQAGLGVVTSPEDSAGVDGGRGGNPFKPVRTSPEPDAGALEPPAARVNPGVTQASRLPEAPLLLSRPNRCG